MVEAVPPAWGGTAVVAEGRVAPATEEEEEEQEVTTVGGAVLEEKLEGLLPLATVSPPDQPLHLRICPSNRKGLLQEDGRHPWSARDQQHSTYPRGSMSSHPQGSISSHPQGSVPSHHHHYSNRMYLRTTTTHQTTSWSLACPPSN